jgi:hypothetical protein
MHTLTHKITTVCEMIVAMKRSNIPHVNVISMLKTKLKVHRTSYLKVTFKTLRMLELGMNPDTCSNIIIFIFLLDYK